MCPAADRRYNLWSCTLSSPLPFLLPLSFILLLLFSLLYVSFCVCYMCSKAEASHVQAEASHGITWHHMALHVHTAFRMHNKTACCNASISQPLATPLASPPFLAPSVSDIGWLRFVGSMKLQVSFAECSLFYRALLQKRPIIQSILLTVASAYQCVCARGDSQGQWGMLQHVAACCSMLRHVAACCGELQHVAACCSMLQRVARCDKLT